MKNETIPPDYFGWWRIIKTSQWVDDELDILGPALISLTGQDDRLRMLFLLAYVDCVAAKTGVSFTWNGAWEYDRMYTETPKTTAEPKPPEDRWRGL